jgi:hypothetical protein
VIVDAISFSDIISRNEQAPPIDTLAYFPAPVPAGLRWADIEALFLALGAAVSEGAGSRVRVALNGVRAVFHRPDTRQAAVRSVPDFLTAAGISPTKG